ncbi:hypothetical protein EVAR_66549_1 [Eumeta japonica]|uniref:Uncharacterized protein n=1 Tax=Eumeta variegata TaxID=151549 RepID=A0A4C1ZGQ4_EUMVA|nr:hypothetical protein EVAR_66549_1 [Eumeta japonica]
MSKPRIVDVAVTHYGRSVPEERKRVRRILLAVNAPRCVCLRLHLERSDFSHSKTSSKISPELLLSRYIFITPSRRNTVWKSLHIRSTGLDLKPFLGQNVTVLSSQIKPLPSCLEGHTKLSVSVAPMMTTAVSSFTNRRWASC